MPAPASPLLLSDWTVGQAAAAMSGQVEPRWQSAPLAPICTDSRAIAPGEFFLALSGENFDGHRFVPAALERGAAGLIVGAHYSDAAEPGVPVMRVADPLGAYGDLAAALRQAWGGKVLAISGSAGKTTTRRLVAAALAARHAVLEPLRNFNNLIGVPYTLLRLEARHEIAVMELGMNLPGELLRLTQIAQPSAALMTFIGRAHVGMFASERDLVEAKLDLFRGCAPGVPFAVNAACANTLGALAALGAGRRIVQFLGDRPAAPGGAPQVRITRVRALAPVGYRFDLETPHGVLPEQELRMFGRHHLEDVAAAAALLLASELDPALIAPALAGFQTEALRGQIVETGGMTFLLDCYNAAPDSMLAALESLADLPRPQRLVLVLADMRELGDLTATLHAQLLAPLRALAPEAVFGLGPHISEVCAALAAEGTAAQGFATRDDLVEALRRELREGDLVFFKGSHGYRLELAAAALAPQLVSELALADHG